MIYNLSPHPQYSVVVVPFPFADKNYEKKRPAVVLSDPSHQKSSGHTSLLMITSAKNSSWSSDHLIKDLESAGLNTSSVVRQKIFTLDARLIIKKIGKLSPQDQKSVTLKTQKHLS